MPAPPADAPLPTTGLYARYAGDALPPITVTNDYQSFTFTNRLLVDRGNGFFDFPVSSGQTHLEVTADGIYKLRVNISVKTVDTDTLFFRLFRNGATASWQESARNTIGGNEADTISMTGVLDLTAGDRLELKIRGTIGTEMQVLAANWEIEKTDY